MEDLLISINNQDPLWIAIAFIFGLAVKKINLPPMIGFLLAGFVLHALGAESDRFLMEIADLGVTLLLFSIGLKLNIKSLLRPEIWASTIIHMSTTIIVTAAILISFGAMGLLLFSGIDMQTALIVAFALSFSSTVFAVKTLEERGAMSSKYGQIAIGVLIMQDIVAVAFLAVSGGKIPSVWALLLFLLIPGRHVLGQIMEWCGHKELLTVYGFVLALGGAAVFEIVGMKGDLGALIVGVLLASHRKGGELAYTLMGFKEVFLVCFFLTIGLNGLPTWETAGTAIILLVLVPFKSIFFFWLFTKFRVRSRGSTLAALGLTNYSEFGLIVAAVAISAGWLTNEWMTVIAIALSISFALAAPLNAYGDSIYLKYRSLLKRFESAKRLTGDETILLKDRKVLVFGMGRVGTAAYDDVNAMGVTSILGIDLDEKEITRHQNEGRNALRGDATSPEFWSRLEESNSEIELIFLAMPNYDANLAAASRLRERGYKGPLVATAKFRDEEPGLKEAGVDEVFNIYEEAGMGAALRMKTYLDEKDGEQQPIGM